MLTPLTFEVSTHLVATARRRFPGLQRVAVVHDEAQAEQFRSFGSKPVIARSPAPGYAVALSVISDLEIGAARIARWMQIQQAQASSDRHTIVASPVGMALGEAAQVMSLDPGTRLPYAAAFKLLADAQRRG